MSAWVACRRTRSINYLRHTHKLLCCLRKSSAIWTEEEEEEEKSKKGGSRKEEKKNEMDNMECRGVMTLRA